MNSKERLTLLTDSTALRFTATAALFAAKRAQILPMN
jgi:hypothetical protein